MLLELIEHYNLLAEQMRIYEADKIPTGVDMAVQDIGFRGMVYRAPDSPRKKLVNPLDEKKIKLGLDSCSVKISEELGQLIDPNCIYYQS